MNALDIYLFNALTEKGGIIAKASLEIKGGGTVEGNTLNECKRSSIDSRTPSR